MSAHQSNDLWYPHPVGVHDLMDAEIKAAVEMGIRFHPVRSYHSVVSDIVPKEVVDTIDGPASSNFSNIMEEMRVSYLLNGLSYGDRPCSAEDILYMVSMITTYAGKVLGLQSHILQEGGDADLVVLQNPDVYHARQKAQWN